MSETPEPRGWRDLLAAVGEGGDVRATLDARGLVPDAALAPAIKDEVDRLLYADRGRAARLAEAAVWVAERCGDRVSRAFADASRARVLESEANFQEAEPLYASASDALRGAGLAVDAAALTRQHILALGQLGRYDEAFDRARRARAVLRRSGALRLLAEHEHNVGVVHYYRDRHADALRHYGRARAMFAELGDDLALAYADHNLAAVLFEKGRYEEAATLYERAADTYRKRGLGTRLAQAQLALAYVEFLKGNYQRALRDLASVQERAGEALGADDLALTDLDLADVYLHLNAHAEALARANRAADAFERLGMRREQGVARRLAASALAASGDLATATRLFAEATVLHEEASNTAQVALVRLDAAAAALRSGDWERARDEARVARETFRRLGLAPFKRAARLLEARAARGAGDLVGACRIVRGLLRDAVEPRDDHIAYQCHQVLAEAAAARGRRDDAIASYRRAAELVERLRGRIGVDELKSSFLEDKASLFDGAVRLCLESGTAESVEEAFRMLELGKSRALVDLLSDFLRESLPGESASREARERFKRALDELALRRAQLRKGEGEPPAGDGARRELRRLTHEVELYEARVAEAFRWLQVEDPRFAELHAPAVVDPAELCALVSDGEALVEYVLAGNSVSAIVATRDGMRAVRDISTTTHVCSLLDGLRFQIEKFAFGVEFAERELAHLRRGADYYLSRLYDALLRPIEREVSDRHLIVVPHGRLHYAPFHAMHDGEGYVVERRGVSYAPSATVYAMCSRAPRAGDGQALLCAVWDAATPAIEQELDALRGLFPAARVLAREEATRAAFVEGARGCRIVHVASHANFRPDNPMLSGIHLADGDLSFYDVFGLRLSADLVVLSGCNTGAVAVGAGDELHGLLRGFLYAGAPSLVISMWAADDAATAGVMRDFYRRLESGSSARDALRAAQRSALGQSQHPYYWAPFMLLGRAE